MITAQRQSSDGKIVKYEIPTALVLHVREKIFGWWGIDMSQDNCVDLIMSLQDNAMKVGTDWLDLVTNGLKKGSA